MSAGVDSEVLKIAIAHEYGTEKLPERSFIRASFDADKPSWVKSCQAQSERFCLDRPPQMPPPTPLALRRPQMVQNFIDDNRVKPQSDFTKKTQHTTLYETGTHIRDRITYKVEEV